MNPEGKVSEAVIIKLIFGVCSSGGQLEEVIKVLGNYIEEDNVEVSRLLLKSRYVDDFMK